MVDISKIDLDEGSSSESDKRPENILSAYRDRYKVFKHAHEYSQKGEIPKAVEKYNLYLGTLAAYYKVKEGNLKPTLFDPKKDMSEMLLISLAYWDLAKAFDRSPKLQKESIRCLNQFVVFSLGFKYQHANANLLKKHLKGKRAHNKKAFQQAFDRLNVESKACYIATYAYPDNIEILETLRRFKVQIYRYRLGKSFVVNYYSISPRIVKFLDKHSLLGSIINSFVFRPIVKLSYKIVKNVTN